MNISPLEMVFSTSVNKSLKLKCMKRKLWIRIGAVLLEVLLLWWLYWAILVDGDENEQEMPATEQID